MTVGPRAMASEGGLIVESTKDRVTMGEVTKNKVTNNGDMKNEVANKDIMMRKFTQEAITHEQIGDNCSSYCTTSQERDH